MRVLVTGHGGFVGQNMMAKLWTELPAYAQIVAASADGAPDGLRVDLTNWNDTQAMFDLHQPDVVVHLAAKVGGIGANMKYPACFFVDTMDMGMNVLSCCAHKNVYCVLVGTVCSYPCNCPVPFKESDLWNGAPEPTNSAYGVAKRGLYKLMEAHHQQNGLQGITLLPTNMYGPYDNINPETSHVIPALMRKFHEAKRKQESSVTLWGTGEATREFLYVDDFIRAVGRAITQHPDHPGPVNVAGGDEVSIAKLADIIMREVGYTGEIRFDTSKPDGQPRRKVNGLIASQLLNYEPQIPLPEGIHNTYRWYKTEGR